MTVRCKKAKKCSKNIFQTVKTDIVSISLLQFQKEDFKLKLWALGTRLDHRQISRLKQMAVRSKKAAKNLKFLTNKKLFSTASILLKGVAGDLRGCMLSWVTSGVTGCLEVSHVASGDRRGPREVKSGLGVTDGLVGLQMASGAAGDLVRPWVAIASFFHFSSLFNVSIQCQFHVYLCPSEKLFYEIITNSVWSTCRKILSLIVTFNF
jgi:hypothetical protein